MNFGFTDNEDFFVETTIYLIQSNQHGQWHVYDRRSFTLISSHNTFQEAMDSIGYETTIDIDGKTDKWGDRVVKSCLGFIQAKLSISHLMYAPVSDNTQRYFEPKTFRDIEKYMDNLQNNG